MTRKEWEQGYSDKDGYEAAICFVCWVSMLLIVVVGGLLQWLR